MGKNVPATIRSTEPHGQLGDFYFRLKKKFHPGSLGWICVVLLFWVWFSLILVAVQPSLLSIPQHSSLAHQLQNLSHKSLSWFVSWDVIYHKSAPSKTRFFLYLWYKKLLPFLSPYHFHSSIHHICFYELFFTK